jgi:hypothetical protein
MGLRPIRESMPLRLGAAFHLGAELLAPVFEAAAQRAPEESAEPVENKACEAIRRATQSYSTVPYWCQDLLEWAVERVTVERLLHAYFLRYQGDGLKTIATEQEFCLPLINPETGADSPLWRLAGKIDRIVQLPDGRLAVLETKTSSSSLDDGSDYWARLRLDSQISLYYYAARQLGYEVQTVLYDVVRKPLIDVMRATPLEKRKFTKDGRLYANQRDRDETPDEFAERLTSDIAARPEFYFARKEIPRLEADLAEAQAEWWQQAHLLRECQRTGRWFRNTQSCLQPFRCEYCEICFTGARPEESIPTGFRRVENVHPELRGESSDGASQPSAES